MKTFLAFTRLSSSARSERDENASPTNFMLVMSIAMTSEDIMPSLEPFACLLSRIRLD